MSLEAMTAAAALLAAGAIAILGRRRPGGPGRNWRELLRSSRAGGDSLRRGAALRLTPQHTLHVVSWRDREWLLSCHAHGITVVAQQDKQEPAESGRAVAAC